MAKRIILTGGGTAGHVTPNLALLDGLRAEGYEIHYVGTADGMERGLVEKEAGVTYHGITAGKLRRYFSLHTLAMPFRVLRGISQSRRIIKKLSPAVVFSKGGYVSVPVVIAAHGKAPIITHESDYTPGLANRITARFADKVCVTFSDTAEKVGKKAVHTGTPIRRGLYYGNKESGLSLAGMNGVKPVLLVMGGSQGAEAINTALRAALPELNRTFDIIHLCGKGKLDPAADAPGYKQFEYVSGELPDLFACTDIVLSRAGANAVFEFLALAKPSLLVPLPLSVSRGDQLLNAAYFERKGYAMVLEQERLTPAALTAAVNELYSRRLSFISVMQGDPLTDGTDEVLAVIRDTVEAYEARRAMHGKER